MVKYLAAYALVALSGAAPTKDAVKAVLKAGNVAVDEARLTELFAQFEGKNFADVIEAGKKKISVGGASAGAAPAAAAAAPAAGKKEEKKVEEEEEDGDMGFGLFD
jgi:large subunit ribosomal protein LP2